MLVRYHMTRTVHAFAPNKRAEEALEEMRVQRIRFAPVRDGESLVGVVTERDLLRKLPGTLADTERQAAAGNDILLVTHAMTRDVLSVGPNDHIEEAARLMCERKVNGLLVLDGNEFLGVITATDLLRTLMHSDAAQEGHRLTVLVPAFGTSFDLAAICSECGLQINTLLRHRTPGGAHLATVRVGGPREALDAFLSRLRSEGAILVEDEGLKEAG